MLRNLVAAFGLLAFCLIQLVHGQSITMAMQVTSPGWNGNFSITSFNFAGRVNSVSSGSSATGVSKLSMDPIQITKKMEPPSVALTNLWSAGKTFQARIVFRQNGVNFATWDLRNSVLVSMATSANVAGDGLPSETYTLQYESTSWSYISIGSSSSTSSMGWTMSLNNPSKV